MLLKALADIPLLHSAPITKIIVENCTIIIETEDQNENPVKFIFTTYQALRVTTGDCCVLPLNVMVDPRVVYEVEKSTWILELKSKLKQVDGTASFLDKSHHFLFPHLEDYIEIVAWGLEIEMKSQSNTA